MPQEAPQMHHHWRTWKLWPLLTLLLAAMDATSSVSMLTGLVAHAMAPPVSVVVSRAASHNTCRIPAGYRMYPEVKIPATSNVSMVTGSVAHARATSACAAVARPPIPLPSGPAEPLKCELDASRSHLSCVCSLKTCSGSAFQGRGTTLEEDLLRLSLPRAWNDPGSSCACFNIFQDL